MSLTTPFSDMVVLEWGRRVAVRGCGSLLAQLGAQVLFPCSTPSSRDTLSRFKQFVPDNESERLGALESANIVLISSDRADELPIPSLRPDVIVCDITVLGQSGRGGWSDPLLQAASGMADITGMPASPPTICEVPVIELQGAILAAAGILAAWRHRAETGEGQTVGLSLLDCGLNGLSSFLPLAFAGKSPRRSGNRHPMAVPWNSYRARDGWVLLCSATDDHWVRLCALMGREELSRTRFAKLADRIAHCDEVDAEVETWTRTLSVEECTAALGKAGLAAGPILTLEGLKADVNLAHRCSISGTVPLPLSFLKTRFDTESPRATAESAAPLNDSSGRPLAGMLVLEIGQYTTAPLAAKQLALLGAEVLKIEPPGGEASRAWPPHQDGQGYFFTMNNANKRSCVLDLRSDEDRATFVSLIRRADVLIENLKPGSLARLGFGTDVLKSLNAKLVYCGISGFGQASAYPGRAAFDTVIQAMSGLMDVTRVDGVPVKLGISAADITGGMAGLLAVLAALEERRRTGRGVMVDLAMQDVAVWVTQTAWNDAPRPDYAVLRCADGYVVADVPCDACDDISARAMNSSRMAVIAELEAAGIEAAPVRTLTEIAGDPSVVGEGAVAMLTGADGRTWPLFRSPFRFSAFAPVPLAPIGKLGEANEYLSPGLEQDC